MSMAYRTSMWHSIRETWQRFRLQISLAGVFFGIILLVIGVQRLFVLLDPSMLAHNRRQDNQVSVESQDDMASSLDASSDDDLRSQGFIMIDIQGAVVRPGMYQLPQKTRIGEVIRVVGGFTDQADWVWLAENFNQAESMQDKEKLFIPFFSQEDASVNATNKKTTAKKVTTKNEK